MKLINEGTTLLHAEPNLLELEAPVLGNPKEFFKINFCNLYNSFWGFTWPIL